MGHIFNVLEDSETHRNVVETTIEFFETVRFRVDDPSAAKIAPEKGTLT